MSDEGGIETELSRGRRIDKERDGARGERGEKSEPCIQRGYRERLRKEEGGQIYRQKGEKMENRTVRRTMELLRRNRRDEGRCVPGSRADTKFETINRA